MQYSIFVTSYTPNSIKLMMSNARSFDYLFAEGKITKKPKLSKSSTTRKLLRKKIKKGENTDDEDPKQSGCPRKFFKIASSPTSALAIIT